MVEKLLNMLEDSPQLDAERIKATARKAGFDLVGIAKAESMKDEFEHFAEWLDSGYHATMKYLEHHREKRENIELVLPGAKSVIVVGLSYHTSHVHSEEVHSGKLSRYAWGTDYHEILPQKMQAIVSTLQELHPDSSSKIYVDTGPISEKQWARKAGIGWQGKHSNIISREIGSWFFIGVIITTVPLAHDKPIQDFCGTCTACIDACPTDAIIRPYTVDAGKCLSYWTIEAKPDIQIPQHIADNAKGWIFGCDICQDVCPWNTFAQETTVPDFHPRNNETNLQRDQILNMKQEEFSERFRKSPVKRTKLAGIQRNALSIIQNTQSENGNT